MQLRDHYPPWACILNRRVWPGGHPARASARHSPRPATHPVIARFLLLAAPGAGVRWHLPAACRRCFAGRGRITSWVAVERMQDSLGAALVTHSGQQPAAKGKALAAALSPPQTL